MIVDLRRFNYPFEPLVRQQQWKLDLALARLGKAQAALTRAREHLEELRELHRAGSRAAAERLTQHCDPAGHTRSLLWLAQLRTSILEAEHRVEELRRERTLHRAECMARQNKLDLLAFHRKESLSEFGKEELNRMAAESDREWLARSSHRQGQRRTLVSRGRAKASGGRR